MTRDRQSGVRSLIHEVYYFFVRVVLVSVGLLLVWLGNSLASPVLDFSVSANSNERPVIRVEEGRLSAMIEGASLADILGEISAQTGITMILHGSPIEKISARFESVTLDEALRRLIKESFVLLYSSGTEEPEVEIWIVSSGASVAPGRSLSPATEGLVPRPIPESGVSLDSLLQQLRRGNAKQRQETVWRLGDFKDKSAVAALIGALAGDKDPDVRRQAAWVLEQLGDPRAVDALVVAVSADSDESVRQRAVEALAKIGGQKAIEPLRSVLRKDPDPFVRFEALANLAEIAGDEVKDLLLLASQDPDELVRDKAQELLRNPQRR